MTEIYKITCNVCNKIYIGKHKVYDKLLNNYFGSGKKQTQHLKEHKKENQVKEIILYCEDKDVKYYEEKFIELHNATNPEIGLNISKKSKGVDKHSEETKQKISELHLGNKYNLGKKHSEETKKLWSEQRKGNKYSLGYKNKLGKKHSEESKKRMSKAKLGNKSHLGKKHSEETKKKISKAHIGKKLSIEHRQKISNSMLRNKHEINNMYAFN